MLSLSERGATGNAAAKLMHLTRDTLLLADDAAPDRSLRAAAERVAGIVRLQYNGEVRDRLDRDAELQRPTPPRGSLIVSAEVGPSTPQRRTHPARPVHARADQHRNQDRAVAAGIAARPRRHDGLLHRLAGRAARPAPHPGRGPDRRLCAGLDRRRARRTDR